MRELILAPGEGLSVENPLGGVFTFKITSDESDGALTAIETVVERQDGPPLHVHDQDEVIYTLEGSLRVKLGDTLREVPSGSFVFIPRGTPHTWQNTGAAFSRGDPDPVKELYSEADDVTLANPFGPARRGREAVIAALDYDDRHVRALLLHERK